MRISHVRRASLLTILSIISITPKITKLNAMGRIRSSTMIVIAASFWPTSQHWVLQVFGTRSNQRDCARRVRAGLSSARVAATGVMHVCTERSIECNLFKMISLSINMSDSVSGITPIEAIYGVIDASLLRLECCLCTCGAKRSIRGHAQ